MVMGNVFFSSLLVELGRHLNEYGIVDFNRT